MMRQRPGGTTPFSPTPRPNVFSQIGANDMIERVGEQALWFRMQPCPCPPMKRIPDCTLCLSGEVRSFQRTRLIESEQAYVVGSRLYTRWGPIEKAISAVRRSGRDRGRNLKIKRIGHDSTGWYIEVDERLEYYAATSVTYEVAMIQPRHIEGELDNSSVLDPGAIADGWYLAGVRNLAIDGKELVVDGHLADKEKMVSVNLSKIFLSGRMSGEYRAELETVSSIGIAYRTADVSFSKSSRGSISLEQGQVEIITPSDIILGQGDIITFLTTRARIAHYVGYTTKRYDYLAFSPVAEIDNITARYRLTDGSETLRTLEQDVDYRLVSRERIEWLTDKPPGGYSVLYTYHPSYRILPGYTGSGGLNRNTPRQYKGAIYSHYKPDGMEQVG